MFIVHGSDHYRFLYSRGVMSVYANKAAKTSANTKPVANESEKVPSVG